MIFNASIVLYNTPTEQVQHCLHLLLGCASLGTIFVVDNSQQKLLQIPLADNDKPLASKIRYVFNNKNLGYGTAHNIALRESMKQDIPFHLVLNTDVQFESAAIEHLLRFAEQYPDVGSVMPKIVYPNGELQPLCKLLPTPLDLFLRRFVPTSIGKNKRAKFELKDSHYDRIRNIPFLSGCFMLLSVNALKEVGLFDERYFMYAEDVDITRRLHRHYLTLFCPEVVIVHKYGRASYHSKRLLWVHIKSMCKYFNKWGWFFDKERKRINQETLAQLKND